MEATPQSTESQAFAGGWIAAGDNAAGAENALPSSTLGQDQPAAFMWGGPAPSAIPVMIAMPHGGRAYPQDVVARLHGGLHTAVRLEDRRVDELGLAVAKATGARWLMAQAPRAMIDLNRHPRDIDWDMPGLKDGGAGEALLAAQLADMPPLGVGAQRARSGLGLVPRRLPGLSEIWAGRLSRAELAVRLAGIHRPYHARLGAELAALRARWGAVLLIDLHSMPPLATDGGVAGAQLVVGDRFGQSCAGTLAASVFAASAAAGRFAAHNRPYAGGYGLERHAAPRDGVHAMQLEICRSAYLDAALREPGEGFDSMVAFLAEVVRKLAAQVAAMGALQPRSGTSDWAQAAE